MEILQQIFINIVANFIWVVLVFLVLFVRDRKKKEQMTLCSEAYLIFLLKSSATVRSSIYPYVYLIDNKTIQGTILSTLLDHIYDLTSNIAAQTQNILPMIESRQLQQKVLQLFHKVTIFQSRVAESQVATNIIVGNPTDLVEPPKQQEEMQIYARFAQEFDKLVGELYASFPVVSQQKIPAEILQLRSQKVALEENYQPKA